MARERYCLQIMKPFSRLDLKVTLQRVQIQGNEFYIDLPLDPSLNLLNLGIILHLSSLNHRGVPWKFLAFFLRNML